jgi:hypothetical protein
MAFSNGKLSDIQVVGNGSTVGIITVVDSKKVYVRSILAYSPTGSASTAHVYVVPNGGSVGDSTKLFNVDVTANETILLEPIYPIVLDTTGDTLHVGVAGSSTNFFITGDKEA